MPGESLCRYLEWDSEFFGRRIASASVSRLRADMVGEILAWCRTNRIECLYCLADSDEPSHVIKAMKPDSAASRQMIRFSIGENTNGSVISSALVAVKGAVSKLLG